MWDERYSCDEYVYGIEPNDFLAANLEQVTGKVLSLAEGEGRNATFLARNGFDVWAVDGSKVGLEKAQKLAAQCGVHFHCEVADFNEYQPPQNEFDTVISIFAHLPSPLRKSLHQKAEDALKSGGIFMLEGYNKAQLERDTGGPKNPDMLFSAEDLIADFPNCDVVLAQEIEREVHEGVGHNGLASVVQLILRKR